MSNRSLVSAKFRGSCWSTLADLGSVSSTSYVIADHYIFAIFVAVALHERPGSLRNPIAILFIFRIVKPGTSSLTRGTNLEAYRRFSGLSYIYVYLQPQQRKNGNVEYQ